MQDKVKAARDLIHRLHSEKPSLVHSMELLCEAYIDLAYHDVSTHRKERKPIKFPASCPLVRLAGQLKEIAVPTVDMEVSGIKSGRPEKGPLEYRNSSLS